jgi:hypothetical protein
MVSPKGKPVNTIVLRIGGSVPGPGNCLVNAFRGTNLYVSEPAGSPNSFPYNPVLPPLYHCKPGTIGAEY